MSLTIRVAARKSVSHLPPCKPPGGKIFHGGHRGSGHDQVPAPPGWLDVLVGSEHVEIVAIPKDRCPEGELSLGAEDCAGQFALLDPPAGRIVVRIRDDPRGLADLAKTEDAGDSGLLDLREQQIELLVGKSAGLEPEPASIIRGRDQCGGLFVCIRRITNRILAASPIRPAVPRNC